MYSYKIFREKSHFYLDIWRKKNEGWKTILFKNSLPLYETLHRYLKEFTSTLNNHKKTEKNLKQEVHIHFRWCGQNVEGSTSLAFAHFTELAGIALHFW